MGDVHDAEQVDRDHPLAEAGVGLDERPRLVPARAVDDDPRRPQALAHGGGEALDRLGRRHVDREGVQAGRRGGLLGAGLVDVGGRHLHPEPAQRDGGRAPDARPRARHHCDTSGHAREA